MKKVVSVVLGAVLLPAVSVCRADEASVEQMLHAEYQENRTQIEAIFQEKIQKISAHSELPEDMRALLVSQADEIRQMDQQTLMQKLDLKLRQARERDVLKEKMRNSAVERVKVMIGDDGLFDKNKKGRRRLSIFGTEMQDKQEKAVEPAKTEKAAQPAEPAKTEKAAQPAEPAKTEEVAQPAEPAKTEEAAQPAEPAKDDAK